METTTAENRGKATVSASATSPLSLTGLFNPQSIAIIGATEKQGAVGRTVVENLKTIQYAGQIYPVNPKRDSILGIKAYPNIGAIGQPVEVAGVVWWTTDCQEVPGGQAPGFGVRLVNAGETYRELLRRLRRAPAPLTRRRRG